MNRNKKARVIAYYLPQYHPIPENNQWWGNGFTEWTNVAKARPLFKGHIQPKIPADLGFYDLRLEETRIDQARLAAEAGIEGFCYWHYYFGNGRRLLERPFNEVLISGKPDFPFCLGWANHSWYKKTFDNTGNDQLLIKQEYGGAEDYSNHFYDMRAAFVDPRYMKINGKLIFVIFDVMGFKDFPVFKNLWNELAQKEGLEGFAFIGYSHRESDNQKMLDLGYDYVNVNRLSAYFEQESFLQRKLTSVFRRWFKRGRFIHYDQASKTFTNKTDGQRQIIPSIIPNWDHSPRSGKKFHNFYGANPESFARQVNAALENISEKDHEEKILFLKSWNEWGEGNYMEPDEEFGRGYIDALRFALQK